MYCPKIAASRIRIFPVRSSWVKRFLIPDPDPHKRSIFNPKIVSKLSEIYSGMFIPDPDLDFYLSRTPDLGVKKATDPGSGSATLFRLRYVLYKIM
jgi:hypothetical protein